MPDDSDVAFLRGRDWDRVDDRGHLIAQRRVVHPAYGEVETEIDLTALYQTARRTTGDPDLLVIEAELAADPDDSTPANPARPLDSDVAKAAVERIEQRGIRPAWEVVRDGD